MIAIVDHQERVAKTRIQLSELRARGYRYLATTNDGDSWVGSNDSGLEIDELISVGFMGTIDVDG